MTALKSAFLFLSFVLPTTVLAAGNVSISVPNIDYTVIPAQASSCFSIRDARGTGLPPEVDVESAYVFIPRITFTRNDASKPLTISTIKISGKDNYGYEISKTYAGGELAALKASWFQLMNATEPIGSKSFSSDCKIYLGGLSSDSDYTSTGTLEVSGYEGDDNTQEQLVPFKVSTTFKIVFQH